MLSFKPTFSLSSFIFIKRVPGCISTGVAERSYPMPEVSSGSREELPHTCKRSNPTSKEQLLHGHRRSKRSYSTFKVRRGGHEEISLVQGKEQWLCFAGAAVKRYPTSQIRETQVRW